MKLFEILNKNFIDLEVIEDSELTYEVETKIGDRVINFTGSKWKSKIVGEPAYWSIEFSESSPGKSGHNYTLTKSGKEFEVFAFIKQCFEHMIKKHHPEVIKFTADKSNNEGRAALYEKMLKKFLTGYKMTVNQHDKEVKFTLEKI